MMELPQAQLHRRHGQCHSKHLPLRKHGMATMKLNRSCLPFRPFQPSVTMHRSTLTCLYPLLQSIQIRVKTHRAMAQLHPSQMYKHNLRSTMP